MVPLDDGALRRVAVRQRRGKTLLTARRCAVELALDERVGEALRARERLSPYRGRVQVSVVIPARNAAATLPAQLAALAQQDFEGVWEIVVADNGSTDATDVVIDRARDALPQLRSVRVDRRGVNVARNAGARAADGDLILLCDADDEVSRHWVSEMVDALQAYDIVGGALEYDRLSDAQTWRPGQAAVDALPMAFGYPYAVSANLGFRRAVLDATDGFDETLGYGGEDIDFSWRAAQAGFQLGFARRAVVHYRLRSGTRALMRQQYSYARGEAHVYAKHARLGNVPSRTLSLQIRAFAGDLYDLVRSARAINTREGRVQLARRAAWFAGTVSGAVKHGVFV